MTGTRSIDYSQHPLFKGAHAVGIVFSRFLPKEATETPALSPDYGGHKL